MMHSIIESNKHKFRNISDVCLSEPHRVLYLLNDFVTINTITVTITIIIPINTITVIIIIDMYN